VIDPDTRSVTTIGSFTGTDKWAGGVLAPNGKIYAPPQESTKILEINPMAKGTWDTNVMLSAYFNKY
jgi:hypothetical protein